MAVGYNPPGAGSDLEERDTRTTSIKQSELKMRLDDWAKAVGFRDELDLFHQRYWDDKRSEKRRRALRKAEENLSYYNSERVPDSWIGDYDRYGRDYGNVNNRISKELYYKYTGQARKIISRFNGRWLKSTIGVTASPYHSGDRLNAETIQEVMNGRIEDMAVMEEFLPAFTDAGVEGWGCGELVRDPFLRDNPYALSELRFEWRDNRRLIFDAGARRRKDSRWLFYERYMDAKEILDTFDVNILQDWGYEAQTSFDTEEYDVDRNHSDPLSVKMLVVEAQYRDRVKTFSYKSPISENYMTQEEIDTLGLPKMYYSGWEKIRVDHIVHRKCVWLEHGDYRRPLVAPVDIYGNTYSYLTMNGLNRKGSPYGDGLLYHVRSLMDLEIIFMSVFARQAVRNANTGWAYELDSLVNPQDASKVGTPGFNLALKTGGLNQIYEPKRMEVGNPDPALITARGITRSDLDAVYGTGAAASGGDIPSGASGSLVRTLQASADLQHVTEVFNVQAFMNNFVDAVWARTKPELYKGFEVPVKKRGQEMFRTLNMPMDEMQPGTMNEDDRVTMDKGGNQIVNSTEADVKMKVKLDTRTDAERVESHEKAFRVYDKGLMGPVRLLKELDYEDPEEMLMEAREGTGMDPAEAQAAGMLQADGTAPSLPDPTGKAQGVQDKADFGTTPLSNK